MKKLIAPLLVGALVIGGGAFYGGTVYAKKTAQGNRAAGGNRIQFAGNGAAGGGTFRMNGGLTAGEIISKDETGFIVKLRDGGSKNVLTASSTTVGKMTNGSMDDLVVGTQVTVIGAANQDGSVTANSVQIRPEGSDAPGIPVMMR